MNSDTQHQWLTPNEVCARWKMKPAKLRYHLNYGNIPSLQIGEVHRIALSVVERFEQTRDAQGVVIIPTKPPPPREWSYPVPHARANPVAVQNPPKKRHR